MTLIFAIFHLISKYNNPNKFLEGNFVELCKCFHVLIPNVDVHKKI